MKKETLVAITPLLHIYMAVLMVSGYFLILVPHITPLEFSDELAPWRLGTVWFFIVIYSLWFVFNYISLRWRIWLEIVPARIMDNKNPLLEWVSVIGVFSGLALIISRLTYAIGLSDNLNTFFLWILLPWLYPALIKKLSLGSVVLPTSESSNLKPR